MSKHQLKFKIFKERNRDLLRAIFNCIRYSDKVLWTIIILISMYSLLLVKSISRESFNYFTVQFISVIIGLLGAYFLQMIDYKVLAEWWKWIAVVCVGLIFCTLFAGIKIEGSMGVNARAWIALPGGITFQPSELVKIGFILTFSKHLSEVKKSSEFKCLKEVVGLGIHALVPVILTHLQGDDGAAIIFLCIALVMVFMAGLPLRYFLFIAVLGAIAAPLMWKLVLADYQKKRILTQLNPEADPLNMGYQQIQSKLSIGSGGVFGYGLFKGLRVANGVVPIQESDFIFSAAGEELGFIGCLVLLLLLLAFIFRVGYIAWCSGESIGMCICFGFIGLVMSQTIFNLGMCLSLLPVMGVTLPFISVGGSSAACLYLGVGIVQSVYLNRDQTKRILNIERYQ